MKKVLKMFMMFGALLCAMVLASNLAKAEPAPNYLTFTAKGSDSSVTFSYDGGGNVQYSKNGGTWTTCPSGTTVSLSNSGDYVKFKGRNVTTTETSHFSMTGKIAASGSVTSLTDENGGDKNVVLQEGCYMYMFYGCSSLTEAPELPAVNLTYGCYALMFGECSSLIKAPTLPAEQMQSGCYLGMFYACSSLKEAPALPAKNLAGGCYESMFSECVALEKAPNLSAEVMSLGCYAGMFSECTSLKKAPDLLAKQLAAKCYMSMFAECISLGELPDLPATTPANECYKEMFYGCYNLYVAKNMLDDKGISTAFTLPNDVGYTNCYKSMFGGNSGKNIVSEGDRIDADPTAGVTYYKGKPIYITGVEIKSASASDHLNEGRNHFVKRYDTDNRYITLRVTLSPDNASNKSIEWTSSDESVIKLQEKDDTILTAGFKALSIGEATIKATAKDGSGCYGEWKIRVLPDDYLFLEYLTISSTGESMLIGDTKNLQIGYVPHGIGVEYPETYKGVSWKSSNPSVATVDANGKITAVAEGNAVITANSVTETDQEAYCEVTVRKKSVPVTGITISPNTISVKKGESKQLTVAIIPSDATVKTVNWASSDMSVATVDDFGKVKGVSKGRAVITATAADGSGVSGTCTVTVTEGTPAPTPTPTINPDYDPTSPDVTKKFKDVSKDKWYGKGNKPIQYVVDNGIMVGTGDGTTFSPEVACTRSQFVQIIYNVEGKPGPGPSNPFTDVRNRAWYTDAITWAYANGITSGKTATTFAPDEDVTRETIAQFLFSYAKWKGYDTSARADLSGYSDSTNVSGWARNAVQWANGNGIINGYADGTLGPKKVCTRAEIAQMTMNFLKRFRGY